MSLAKILIVEDEILIADNIKRFLKKKGYEIIGIAISYQEAIHYIKSSSPDIVLLDIRLNGIKSGIDVGEFLKNQPEKIPFIFLTSQLDQTHIDKAKLTFPSGYLSKPIQHESLLATIEIILHKKNYQNTIDNQIRLQDGNTKHLIHTDKIKYIQAEHVYVKLHIMDGEQILHRSTLKDILSKLPKSSFVQTHRSFVVNIRHIDSWDTNSIYIGNNEIPMSRSKKKDVLDMILT